MTIWNGDEYQDRFDRLVESGQDVHGEADFVQSLGAWSVLDAGCGTGRVAIELARRNLDVVGVDVDPSMLATARRLAPGLAWIEADLTTFHLGRRFEVVLLAGNVPLFAAPGTQAALVERCAAHVAEGGCLVAGFSLDRGYGLEQWDEDTAAAGLEMEERFATWARDPFTGGDYAVSVHRRTAGVG